MSIVTAKPNASARTKNRIKHHGPSFKVGASSSISLFGVWRPCRLLDSDSTNWVGWLPDNEIEITQDKET